MTEQEFLRHLADYGADPARWPAELRAAAHQLLAGRTIADRPALRDLLAAEAAFDRRLAGVVPVVDEARVRHLVASVTRAARDTPRGAAPDSLLVFLLGPLPRPAAAALGLGLLLLGWVIGATVPHVGTTEVALPGDDVTILFDGDGR
ncbi:hypothetical protein [Azospirillum thermophilum]|uniref:Uncharacterized protein n=1 Tax=Azospirillum thermophilum TaxID=2202148 RepID=A0A2S2CZU1_9PROT|nr:hypothetical protein [Azospirillum thermophilum]AWK90034.1 hypothetical protein DEW08_29005 [Azospirillum thermophilum]